MSEELGELHRVDLRIYWSNEAAEFTPWLASEENIAKLAEALGIDLEVESTEVAAGPYSADILARDTVTGDYVVIENQLGKTDHDHLGKAITYAAVLNASAVVWIAGQFTDEHKKSLDWLKQPGKPTEGLGGHTGEGESWYRRDSSMRQPLLQWRPLQARSKSKVSCERTYPTYRSCIRSTSSCYWKWVTRTRPLWLVSDHAPGHS